MLEMNVKFLYDHLHKIADEADLPINTILNEYQNYKDDLWDVLMSSIEGYFICELALSIVCFKHTGKAIYEPVSPTAPKE